MVHDHIDPTDDTKHLHKFLSTEMLDKLQDDFDSMTSSVDKMREDGHGQQKSLEELFRIVGHLQVNVWRCIQW